MPAAALFRNADRQGLPSPTGGLVVLQTLGAVAPSLSAYLLLRASGHRDLLGWIGSRYRIWRVHPGWYLVAGLLAPTITLVSLGCVRWPTPLPRRAASPLGEMLADLGVVGIVMLFPLLVAGHLPSSPLLEEFGWREFALPALQTRWRALVSSVVLGLVWGVWHRPLMVVYGDPLVPTCC